jgi:hypothetical protein
MNLPENIEVIPKKIFKNLPLKLWLVIPEKAGIHCSEWWIPAKNVRE